MATQPNYGREAIQIQKYLSDNQTSSLTKYQALIIGKKGLGNLARYEIITLLSSWVPGALGLFLRSKLYPLMLGKVGKNVIFGTNVVLRHPHKIFLGNNVVVDDNCLLDAKGTDNQGIVIGDDVFIGRNTILSCKNGDIILANHVNIGFNCEIVSASRVSLGERVLMAAYGYLMSADHDMARTDVPISDQPRGGKGINIEDDVWLGAGVKVTDGVTIRRDSIIGTGSVVSTDISEYSIALGFPARVVKKRKNIVS